MSAAVRPEPGLPRPYHFPAFESRTLGNGLRLVVAPVHKLPLVSVIVVVDAGAITEPAGREGVAYLAARGLLEGTATMGGADLTERLELLGASLDAGADWDAATLGMTVLASGLTEALALLGQVMLEPAFPEADLKRLKAERLADVLQLRAEPRGLADEMFGRFLYDPISRYASPDHGGAQSVSALTRADVEAFYDARYRPAAVTLIMAGDISAANAEAAAERVFGAWRGDAPPSVLINDLPARRARAVHLVDKSDAAQSELRIGHMGLPRRHPDFFPVTVMNAVLGGLFSSRINLNLREVHGYTYGASSGFDWRRGTGPFEVSTAVRSDITDAAIREVLTEIDRMRAERIGEEELTLATSYLAGVFPIRYETTAAIARALAGMMVYGLPPEYFDRYRTNIQSVTAAEVQRVAQQHLHPDQLQVIVVGDPALVRAPLEALAFGPLTVYDVDGVARPGR